MFRQIHIKNFRALREFGMTGLGRVNLLVGTNNCGKTSVLEAIHILSVPGSPNPLWSTLLRRGETRDDIEGVEIMLLELRAGDRAIEEHVGASVERAKELGAPYRHVHRAKAELHTWLAWQDPPGLQMHLAVRARLLRPTEAVTSGFVAWFRRLFQV